MRSLAFLAMPDDITIGICLRRETQMQRPLPARGIFSGRRRLYKSHAKLVAVTANDLAAPVDSAACGDRQKEFLVRDGRRWVGDRQPRAGLRNIGHHACDTPRAIDADDV